jgi:hypothetical protein
MIFLLSRVDAQMLPFLPVCRKGLASGQQDKMRSRDSVKTGVGVVLFWPVLLFMDGDGPKVSEIASLKGQMDAMGSATIQKKCRVSFV